MSVPAQTAVQAFVRDPLNRQRVVDLLDDFARVGIPQPSRTAIMAAGMVADILEFAREPEGVAREGTR